MKFSIGMLLLIATVITLILLMTVYIVEYIIREIKIRKEIKYYNHLKHSQNKVNHFKNYIDFLSCYYIALTNNVLKFYDKSKDYYELKYGD